MTEFDDRFDEIIRESKIKREEEEKRIKARMKDVFTEEDVEKYYQHNVELVGSEEDIINRCHTCGRFLNEVELPKGLEKKVTCLDCRDYFMYSFAELEDMGEI